MEPIRRICIRHFSQQGPGEGLKAGPLQCQWQKNVKCQLEEVCHHSAVPRPCRPAPPPPPAQQPPTLSHSDSPPSPQTLFLCQTQPSPTDTRTQKPPRRLMEDPLWDQRQLSLSIL